MLAAIIDNGSTLLFDISDHPDINANDMYKDFNNRYIGWLVNRDNISDIIAKMPISRFMLLHPTDKTVVDISIEQANLIFEGLIHLRDQKAKNEQARREQAMIELATRKQVRRR